MSKKQTAPGSGGRCHHLSDGDGYGSCDDHRVAEIDVEKQQFITKGDANRSVDVTPVAFDRLIGEVVFQIPMLGNLSSCLYTGTGIMACSGLFVTVAVLWGIAEKFKLKESAK